MYGILVCDCLCNSCFYEFAVTTTSPLRNLLNNRDEYVCCVVPLQWPTYLGSSTELTSTAALASPSSDTSTAASSCCTSSTFPTTPHGGSSTNCATSLSNTSRVCHLGHTPSSPIKVICRWQRRICDGYANTSTCRCWQSVPSTGLRYTHCYFIWRQCTSSWPQMTKAANGGFCLSCRDIWNVWDSGFVLYYASCLVVQNVDKHHKHYIVDSQGGVVVIICHADWHAIYDKHIYSNIWHTWHLCFFNILYKEH